MVTCSLGHLWYSIVCVYVIVEGLENKGLKAGRGRGEENRQTGVLWPRIPRAHKRNFERIIMAFFNGLHKTKLGVV